LKTFKLPFHRTFEYNRSSRRSTSRCLIVRCAVKHISGLTTVVCADASSCLFRCHYICHPVPLYLAHSIFLLHVTNEKPVWRHGPCCRTSSADQHLLIIIPRVQGIVSAHSSIPLSTLVRATDLKSNSSDNVLLIHPGPSH
jgi:hypothetical protein